LNLLAFLVLWAAAFAFPVPPFKEQLKLLPRSITFLLGLFLFLIFTAVQTPLSFFIYWLIYLRLFFAFIEYAFQVRRRKEDEEGYYGRFGRRRRLKISVRLRARVFASLFILFMLSAAVGISYSLVQQVSNAYYFNSFVQRGSGFPFNGAIPDNQVRLVTQELAVSVARRHMSEFGSNVQVLDSHITKTLEGKLVWIAVIGSTNVLAENYVKGFILIDAADPVAVPQIVHKEFAVGDGLWWDRNVVFRSYLADNTYSYGVAYPTWSTALSDLVYVVARYEIGFDLIQRYQGLIVYDSDGDLVGTYSALSEVPIWATQVYDEDWMERMIGRWGNFRRGEAFDFWAGGFLWIIPPSRDRVEMSEDTRYIVDPDTDEVVAMVVVNPVASDRTLAGVFKATRGGVFLYEYLQEKYISGVTAEDIVEGKLPRPAAGLYYAQMPLLYPIETSENSMRLAWYVPIYWREGSYKPDETIILAGFAIIDALDINTVVINIAGEGLSSEQLVRSTRLDFLELFGAITSIEIDASVLDKQEYVRDGLTHVVLRVDNSTYTWIEATPNDLPGQQWYELLATRINDRITANIEKRGEIWTIVGFDNKNIP